MTYEELIDLIDEKILLGDRRTTATQLKEVLYELADTATTNDVHFVGKYISLVALQTAVPIGLDGDYAIVDPGSGTDAKQYIWDAQEGWLLGSGSGGGTWGSITGTLSAQTDLQSALNAKQNSLAYTPEDVSNKATDFSVVNDTKYATTQSIVNYIAAWWTVVKSATQTIAGVWTFSVSPIVPNPSTSTQATNKGSVDTLLATKQNSLGYTAEDVANKATGTGALANSDTTYPSEKKVLANIGAWSPIQSTQNISGAVSIDLSVAQVFYLTLTGNVSSFTFTNAVVGKQYMFYFIKGSTNFTFGTNPSYAWTTGKFRFPLGVAPDLTNPTLAGLGYSEDIFTSFCRITGKLDMVCTPDMQNN